MKRFACILFCFALSLVASAQKPFDFSDTSFVLGQKHELKQVRYALGGHQQMITDSLTLLEMDSVVAFLEKNSRLSVEIGVHTDHRGSDTMNVKITRFRADYVRNYLIWRGIDSSRITAKGYGESQLIVPETETNKYKTTDKMKYETLHQRNRRTELTIVGLY